MRFSAYFHAAMTRYQLSQVSAMKQVRLVLNRFRLIWQNFAALGVQEAALGSTVELILALAQEQERDNKGIRADKMHLTDLLTDGIMAVAGPLGAWAMVTSNARVRQQADVYPSYLKKEASERLLLIAKDILALGTTHVADAADYALTQPGLDVLRSRIVTFEQLVVAPREGVARTAALTLLIEAEVERGMELLRGFFDRIMYRFKESDTEFYTNYQTARKVIRPSYRSRGEAEAEAEEESAAEGKGAKTAGEVFAPLDNKDYSPYFGQIRSAKPTVLYTSVAGNDTVRLFTQMAEFGVNRNIQVVGASGTVTGQNLAAIGKAADGFVTGVGYSTSIPTAENQKFVAEFTAANKAAPDLYGADSYGVLFAYKAAVEKAKSTDTDAVRTALRGLQWATPQGVKTLRASDHQAMQDMYAVRVNSGKFEIVGKVAAAAAIGADTCTKF